MYVPSRGLSVQLPFWRSTSPRFPFGARRWTYIASKSSSARALTTVAGSRLGRRPAGEGLIIGPSVGHSRNKPP
eukprot:scaffold17121_cov122-Isochrysis_galbana.AAC.4